MNKNETSERTALTKLKGYLNPLYEKFDISYLTPDPLQFLHKFKNRNDQEIVGLISSSLAYGRVERIIFSIDNVLNLMDNKPFDFVVSFTKDNSDLFNRFIHRFNTGRDIASLIYIMQNAIQRYGSIEGAFMAGYSQNDYNIKDAASNFIDKLLDIDLSAFYSKKDMNGIRYLLPSPKDGSACKRLNMFLRWMIRRGDNIDIGIWNNIPPSKLVIPLDTHTARICSYIGLTKKKSVSWQMAEEVTDNLKMIDPLDPVKYDFAICRLGIHKLCRGDGKNQYCDICNLKKICKQFNRRAYGE